MNPRTHTLRPMGRLASHRSRAIAISALVLAAAACGSSSEDAASTSQTSEAVTSTTAAEATTTSQAATSETTTESTEASGDVTELDIVDFAFAPASIEIKVGQTIRWTNNDSTNHTVTSNNGDFDSGTLTEGDTFEFTATEPGEFTYFCLFHTNMQGTITVVS